MNEDVKMSDSNSSYPYKEFIVYDSTPISIEIWTDSRSVEMHCHRFYEFSMITKGSCLHNYRGIEVPLIPGDIFFVEPNQPHSYEIQAQVSIINCQFHPEQLGFENNQMFLSATTRYKKDNKGDDIKRQWEELLQYVTLEEGNIESNVRQANLNAQGIIHLDSNEMAYVESLLKDMEREQERKEVNLEYAKSAYLQLILVMLSRVQNRRIKKINNHSHQKKDMIFDALIYIEEHLDEKVDFSYLSEKSFMSPSYFRSIFKDVTGLTPVDYLNRMRIVKSLEYLETERSTIADAAAKVGIYDSNYYSRMFKKVMGYSPRYFKSIRE